MHARPARDSAGLDGTKFEMALRQYYQLSLSSSKRQYYQLAQRQQLKPSHYLFLKEHNPITSLIMLLTMPYTKGSSS